MFCVWGPTQICRPALVDYLVHNISVSTSHVKLIVSHSQLNLDYEHTAWPQQMALSSFSARYKILRLRFSRIFERHHMFLARSSSSILNNEVFQAKKLSRPWSELFACKSSMFFLTNLHLRSATWWASKWRTHFELCKLVHWQSLPKEIHMQLSNICKIVLSKELFTLH